MNLYYRTVMREKTKARDAREKCGGEPDIINAARPRIASLLLADGKPPAEVSKLGAHYTTLKIHAHFVPVESTATQDLASSVMG